MKLKHNKKRNTAFLYEALIKELTKSIISKDDARKSAITEVLRENFTKSSVLGQELQLYKTLNETEKAGSCKTDADCVKNNNMDGCAGQIDADGNDLWICWPWDDKAKTPANPREMEEDCGELGEDCGKNGANTTNCNFTIFSKPEFTKAWEDGKLTAEVHKR